MAKIPELFIQRSSMINTINGIGYCLRKTGVNPFRLNSSKIIRIVQRRASFFQPVPNAEKGLEKLIYSINTEGHPNPFGVLAVKKLLERTLYGRYKVELEILNNPNILKEEIKQPVFIVGMPRSGTTILHALLHEDPDHRSPLAWECLLPYPVPKPENFNNNKQLNTVRKEFGHLFKMIPDFLRKHYMAADAPQECISINALDFNSFQFFAQLYLPSYMDWFNNHADKLETMRFHKRFLQYLQSGGVKSKRWLLKSPVHLMRLPELFEVYPDAKIIMTHRHPFTVVPSTASLISSVRSLYSDHEVPERTGHEQAEVWGMYLNRCLRSMKNIDKDDQIVHIRFDDFVNDQVTTVKNIYERFNWPLSEETLERFSYFLENNPKDKHGRHNYSLEDFGLNEHEINILYKDYIDFLDSLYSLPSYGTQKQKSP
jgi:hypothetical protein